MRIDFATLAFGYKVMSGGNTPNWATSLGQGKGHKINETPEIDEILKGMIYSGVAVANVKAKIGKGGNFVSGSEANSPISLAAVFNKVYVNDTLITGGKFILLITKDLSGAHMGRFKIKYAPSNTFDDGQSTFSNQDFFNCVKRQLNLADDACWFVSDINIRNQDELIFRTFVVNENGPTTYTDVAALHSAWSAEAPFASPYEGGTNDTLKNAENIILYGVPGAGKSYKIKTEYCDDEAFMERVVFHPDYTYSDFIGQILPTTNGEKITYPFIPGPFTRILKKANDDPENMYFLVVEEINRGNAPAIFGEVFQLLDRKNGESEYGINNADIAKEVYGDAGHPVKIPANLTILATMNTADQNVFTLDTAFKRRWKMESIPNDIAGCGHANKYICGRNVTWFTFADTINNKIIDFGEGNLSSEDNRLGAYFVSEEELSDVSTFAEKVLMYLWNDAFKFDKEKIFKSKYKTLESLIDGFKESYFDVFCDDLNFDNKPVEPETEDGGDAPDIQEYLNGKNEQMVELFNYLAGEVEAVIPTLILQPVNTLQYAKFTCDGISRKSFADIMIKKDSIEAYCEKPLSDELISVVEEQSRDKFHSHNYLYRIKTEEDIETAVQIITESYEQLKTGA